MSAVGAFWMFGSAFANQMIDMDLRSNHRDDSIEKKFFECMEKNAEEHTKMLIALQEIKSTLKLKV
jgi:FKBP-type peptidyl-prolyl cis-trans isomerase (trigger factor)